MTRLLKLKPVVSYTTRAKRNSETEGVEHYFIKPEEAKDIMEKEQVIAYTKIGEIEYFATIEALNGSNVYIIDPKGLTYLRKHCGNLHLLVIYIDTLDAIRRKRAQKRDNIDFLAAFEKRNSDENDQFTEFENKKDWDWRVENNFDQPYAAIKKLTEYIRLTSIGREEDEDPILYCIIGRTGSGKDYLTTEAIKYFEENPVEFITLLDLFILPNNSS